jgi:hypothetical protein
MNDHEKVKWIESGQAQWDMACFMAKQGNETVQEMMDQIALFWKTYDALLAEKEGDEE